MKERGMSVRIRRVVVAGVVAAAAAAAVPAAALASGSPSAKPSPVASKSTAASKSAAAASKSAAAASKSAAGFKSAAAASKPAAASKSAAAASKSAAAGSGTRVDRSLTGPAAVAALARRLGVSTGAAQHALQQIGALSRQGVDPTDPAFVAIAHGLGVSPAQLAAALGGVKQVLAGK